MTHNGRNVNFSKLVYSEAGVYHVQQTRLFTCFLISLEATKTSYYMKEIVAKICLYLVCLWNHPIGRVLSQRGVFM